MIDSSRWLETLSAADANYFVEIGSSEYEQCISAAIESNPFAAYRDYYRLDLNYFLLCAENLGEYSYWRNVEVERSALSKILYQIDARVTEYLDRVLHEYKDSRLAILQDYYSIASKRGHGQYISPSLRKYLRGMGFRLIDISFYSFDNTAYAPISDKSDTLVLNPATCLENYSKSSIGLGQDILRHEYVQNIAIFALATHILSRESKYLPLHIHHSENHSYEKGILLARSICSAPCLSVGIFGGLSDYPGNKMLANIYSKNGWLLPDIQLSSSLSNKENMFPLSVPRKKIITEAHRNLLSSASVPSPDLGRDSILVERIFLIESQIPSVQSGQMRWIVENKEAFESFRIRIVLCRHPAMMNDYSRLGIETISTQRAKEDVNAVFLGCGTQEMVRLLLSGFKIFYIKGIVSTLLTPYLWKEAMSLISDVYGDIDTDELFHVETLTHCDYIKRQFLPAIRHQSFIRKELQKLLREFIYQRCWNRMSTETVLRHMLADYSS